MNDIIGVIDEPVAPGKIDNLDISTHTKSLIRFIQHTNTPITIGIQGEWGSGKTSLLNSIKHHFDQDVSIKQIWINSWEYSLLSTPEEALLKIVNRIIDELLDADKNEARKDKIRKGTKNLMKGALRLGTHIALGEDAANIASELLAGSGASIGALREQLSELSLEIEKRDSNPYKKIIIYVDDLDRIEPKNAVALLELLKNIFSIPNCVFILAIDYQVVIKGLEHKFGKQTADNEWEFRAFFDKIIQLPFMMPMGQYNIGKYVNTLLKGIRFIEEDLDETSIREIVLRTIGGNPRSIKRLVNSVSLIQIFTEENSSSDGLNIEDVTSDEPELGVEELKFLMFSLLCLQIAYPAIYSLLAAKPDFNNWDEEFAFTETKRAEEQDPSFKTEFANACETEDFDEPWEKCLYRICYIRPRLKPRITDISKFLSYIKDEFMANKQDIIGETIAHILSQTSVTSVTSTDQGQFILPERQGAYKRRILEGFEAWVKDNLLNNKVTDEAVDFAKLIYEDLKKEFMDIEFLYAGGMTAYVQKHKFFSCDFLSGKGDKGLLLCLIKHPSNEYKVPTISNIETTQNRRFSLDKPSTAHASHLYRIYFNKKEDFIINKDKMHHLYQLSYDIAAKRWDERLIINNKAKEIVAKNLNVSGASDIEKYNELASKYLDPSYTYEVNLGDL